MMTKTKCMRGFTLIEIMVVVAVIALLGAMIGPTLFNKVQQAEEARVASDLRAIESALKFYRLDNYRYPTQSQGLEALMRSPDGNSSNWNGPYLDSMPMDPWGQEYVYAYPSTHERDFDIYTLGADQQEGGDGADTDWGNWNIQ
ncbi:MAG: type II secretion system protein GspG [Gammaproteobacteria bacterium]|nr:type II secretion system protein GspG [Gammaproteobacteria bacterium]MAY02362.1 type II secretion system protein GspG [Gammaproteobacteria bacterium]